ncbi:transcriptional regulator [Oleiphilus messinensis]|uniref:Transcriptional regulator n=1 Tax=Oleiphilus messinensis TaxID=141451 RepID=A0A1Y0IB27_9GAMM|nr:TetR/AcrR family transcriptional regulator [Oleiphilus messinensis]ARU56593.1 transcriptional regulator [Oleiphilus messinensis]
MTAVKNDNVETIKTKQDAVDEGRDVQESGASLIRKPKVAPRRIPVQARSRERVSTILKVTAEVIQEVGVDRAKTSEIARRAGMSLASLYRYFPNKSAIIKALAEQHIVKLNEHLTETMLELDMESGFDRLIDGYAHFYRHEPGYKEIWSGVEAMPELQQLDLGELYDNAHVISKRASQMFPHIENKRMWVICVMLPRSCGAILRLMMNMDEAEADIMLTELKAMVRAYITHSLGGIQAV